ncbi:hypothetical protein [Compostimonas suwonensis]|uniref:Uncharacterized protein n=1 Tax=Compostimonas suwonensis TaxID=1048394 RepID=A0A2M9C3L9_9MICO|nr:hypothetical protein [Compostimonas suwonensis]PJJ65116.1 hypothetical protein CLV54_0145 [Compostimonas suwonensis]
MSKQNDGSTGFDPRYDPAFQPGFQPESDSRGRRSSSWRTDGAADAARGTAVAAASPSAPAAPTNDTARIAADAARQRLARTTAAAANEEQLRAQQTLHAQQGDELFGLADAVDDEPSAPPSAGADRLPPLRSNPFIWGLWAFAVACVVAGYWFARLAQDAAMQFTSNAPDSWIMQSVAQALSPLLMTVGVATVGALLVIYALRWRGRD